MGSKQVVYTSEKNKRGKLVPEGVAEVVEIY